MQVNFGMPLFDFEGDHIPDVVNEQETIAKAATILQRAGRGDLSNSLLEAANKLEGKGTSFTLGKVCLRSLAAGVHGANDPKLMEEQFRLGEKIRSGDTVEITPEEATLLKMVVAKTYKSPLIAGQCCKILNG